MISKRVFNIVLVNEQKWNGIDICQNPDKSVSYNGKKLEIKF